MTDFLSERFRALKMAGVVKDGAVEGVTSLRIGDSAEDDIRSEVIGGVKRRLPRATTPAGRLAEQVLAAHDNLAARNHMESIGIDIATVLIAVS